MFRSFVVLACLCAPLAAQERPAPSGPPAAATLLSAAFKKAIAEKKAVWVQFGSSACASCPRADAFVHDPEVGKILAASYVVVTLVVQETPENKALENPGAMDLLGQLDGQAAALPFVAFLDARGRKIGTTVFPATADESAAFLKLIEKTAPRLPEASRARVAEYLARMEIR